MIERPRNTTLSEIALFFRSALTLPASLLFRLRGLPHGDGRPVMVLPGFMAGDWSTLMLRRFLRQHGHRVYGWGQGQNQGNVKKQLPGVLARLESIAAACGAPVRLVGWSHGGLLAREAARARPDLIAGVITMGTPVVGGPKYTSTAPTYERRGLDVERMAASADRREAEPLPVPVTAIYSKRDGVVAWEACIDRYPGHDVAHVEVGAGHAEMGLSAEVYRILADLLAH